MAGNAAGALKTAARRVGVPLDEYRRRLRAGEKWCTGCKAWHDVEAFSRDVSRSDGRAARCKQASRTRYVPRPRLHQPSLLPSRSVEARDGDVKQARRTVNAHVEAGRWPHPNEKPCTDCGHEWRLGERRHEYDHHLGYAAEHHEDVEVVCTTCHRRREDERRQQVAA